jgi:hypothetical protein
MDELRGGYSNVEEFMSTIVVVNGEYRREYQNKENNPKNNAETKKKKAKALRQAHSVNESELEGSYAKRQLSVKDVILSKIQQHFTIGFAASTKCKEAHCCTLPPEIWSVKKAVLNYILPLIHGT